MNDYEVPDYTNIKRLKYNGIRVGDKITETLDNVSTTSIVNFLSTDENYVSIIPTNDKYRLNIHLCVIDEKVEDRVQPVIGHLPQKLQDIYTSYLVIPLPNMVSKILQLHLILNYSPIQVFSFVRNNIKNRDYMYKSFEGVRHKNPLQAFEDYKGSHLDLLEIILHNFVSMNTRNIDDMMNELMD
jgi:hypothetical protein